MNEEEGNGLIVDVLHFPIVLVNVILDSFSADQHISLRWGVCESGCGVYLMMGVAASLPWWVR